MGQCMGVDFEAFQSIRQIIQQMIKHVVIVISDDDNTMSLCSIMQLSNFDFFIRSTCSILQLQVDDAQIYAFDQEEQDAIYEKRPWKEDAQLDDKCPGFISVCFGLLRFPFRNLVGMG